MTQAQTVEALHAQLSRMEEKLDYVVERQRFVDEFISEMTPVGRQVLGFATEHLGEMEKKGYFAMGRELITMMDRVVESYEPEDVGQLAENIVNILDTVRNVTQPDVLAVANEATDVLHHADEVKPVGAFGVYKATGNQDVQRGMAIALEILKQLGRTKGGAAAPTRRPPPKAVPPKAGKTPVKVAKAMKPMRAGTDALPAACDIPAKEPAGDVVMWEGHAFDMQGFLVDPTTWDEPLADKMAAAVGIQLTDDHWTMIKWARADFLATGASPNVRRVATGCGLGTRRVYELFPKSPGKTAAIIAGIPKPVGCV